MNQEQGGRGGGRPKLGKNMMHEKNYEHSLGKDQKCSIYMSLCHVLRHFLLFSGHQDPQKDVKQRHRKIGQLEGRNELGSESAILR